MSPEHWLALFERVGALALVAYIVVRQTKALEDIAGHLAGQDKQLEQLEQAVSKSSTAIVQRIGEAERNVYQGFSGNGRR